MGYAGVKDAQERADLIAYLKRATRDPKTCD
jgi:cytochrome c2